MTNRYEGTCFCGIHVPAGAGTAVKTNGRWGVRCRSCGGSSSSSAPTQAASAAPASSARPFPNRYPGKCACGRDVDVGAGVAVKIDGRWGVRCAVCATKAGLTTEPAAPQDTRRVLAADGAIQIPYSEDEGQKALLRSLPPPAGKFSAWDTEAKVWRASVSPADLRRTLEIARRLTLEIAPELLEREKTEHTVEARAAAEIPGLYHFQIEGVEFLASGKNRLLAWDQGVGKTVIALCALPREGELPPVLVIVPNVVKYNWLNEAEKWAPMYQRTALAGRNSFRWPKPGEIVAINYDILPMAAEAPTRKSAAKERPEATMAREAAHEKFIASAPFGLTVIVDECHNSRNNSAKMRRVRGIVSASTRAWGLTGTPLMNHPDQLWRVLQSLDLAHVVFGSWNNFTRLFHASRNRWGGWVWGLPMPEVPERLRRAMHRRTKAEVLPDLPPKRYQVLEINGIGEALRAELDRLWEEWGEVVESEEALPPFEQFSAIRAKLAAARTPAVLEWVEPYEDAGDPLVVFSAHRAPVDVLGVRVGWATITGDTPAEKRTEIVKRFRAGELKGVACTIQAAGVGLTMTRACTALFVDLDWTPALNVQAQDRLHRIGQTAQSVLYVRMVSDHPLDLHIQGLIAQKMELIAASIERLVRVAPQQIAANESAGESNRIARELAAIREAETREAREKCQSITARQRAKLGAEAPELELTPARVAAINEALSAMLGVCDGAMVKDGLGFNKPDAVRSRWLNVLGLNDEAAQRCALSMLQAYRRQLGERFAILWK